LSGGKRGRPSNPVSPCIMRIHQSVKDRYAGVQNPAVRVNACRAPKCRHLHTGREEPEAEHTGIPVTEEKTDDCKNN